MDESACMRSDLTAKVTGSPPPTRASKERRIGGSGSSAWSGSFTSGRWSTSVRLYRQNQQRDSYHQCENPCFRHARLENGFPRALGIETDIDCVPTSIPLHNLLGKIRHSFVHPGALGNSVSTKTLSIDFILIDHDGTIEG